MPSDDERDETAQQASRRGEEAQLNLAGNPAPAPRPDYARDALAEKVRLFNYPQTIRGQLELDA